MPRFALLFGLAVLPVMASQIDVSAQTSTLLQCGDSLVFTVSVRGFTQNAQLYGAPPTPWAIAIQLLTMPAAPDSVLTAAVQMPSGAVSADFAAALHPIAGIFQGSGYQGPVSDFQASLLLPASFSQQLFSGPTVLVTVTNRGPDLAAGLPPYNLRQDLLVTLSAGNLSAGGVPTSVLRQDSPSPAPEPRWEDMLLPAVWLGGEILRVLKPRLGYRRCHSRQGMKAS